MFDWINDAFSWIGSGLTSVWENTFFTTVNDITEIVFEAMFKWTYGLVYDGISELFEFINAGTADIFDLAWVQAFLLLFSYLGWMLFACGFVVSVFDTAVAYESGQNNIKSLCLNTLKGFFAANLVTIVPPRLYTFCIMMQENFASSMLSTFISVSSPSNIIKAAQEVIDTLNGKGTVCSLLFILLFGYCVVKVILANIKRGGILLCQTAVGSLYLFSVPRGFTDGFTNWMRQVIATCLTAFMQTTILYIGLLTFQEHPVLALGICLSADEVPRVAQMFGMDTTTHVNMVSISSAVSMGSRAVRLIAGAP